MNDWGDVWHYALARMVVAARDNGLLRIEGLFGDFQNPEGYRAADKRGFAGRTAARLCLDPSGRSSDENPRRIAAE